MKTQERYNCDDQIFIHRAADQVRDFPKRKLRRQSPVYHAVENEDTEEQVADFVNRHLMIHGENTSKILKMQRVVMRDRRHTEVAQLRMVQTQG